MKKLFSIMTVVALVAGIFTPAINSVSASFSGELEGAYDYAYGMGITTQSSIDTANMYGNLQRSHMAKMMVEYAKSMGKTADTSKACNFNDVAGQSSELQGYITDACQMGLMGVGISSFNPTGTVTRAEFGTVLSRVLWGSANDNGTNPYYAPHLNALKAAGVMNNIDNPSAKEVRGYVMLMMQRADESNVAGDMPAVCSTPENTLACALGLDSCPAECTETPVEETEVKAGNVSVSLGSNNLSDGSEVPSTGIVRFATVNFKASSSSNVSLKSVEIKKIGLAAIDSSVRVWFEKNGVRVSGKAAFSSEGKAVISFAPAFVVKGGSSEEIDLYVELAMAAGSDLQFASVDVSSTAVNVDGSFTTPKLRTANYSVATTTFDVASATGSNNVVSNGMEIGAFKLTNNKPL